CRPSQHIRMAGPQSIIDFSTVNTGVVTNIDPEHMDHYGTVEALRDGFDAFVSNVPFYGALVACIDHPEVQSLIGRVGDRRIITYGTSRQADIRAENIRYKDGAMRFDLVIRDDAPVEMALPMPGEHNVLNALAAIGVARELKIDIEDVARGLSGFDGVKRRFTRVGAWNGATIIDDYGHHPVEISAVLKAARAAVDEDGGKVIAVHQPHRYSRLHDLFEEFCACFNDADIVAITDVFAAGEEALEGVSRDALVGGLRAHGHRGAHAIAAPGGLADFVRTHAGNGDLVVCLGAGTISAWANALPEELGG
ncbi:MAG: Mur ligase family protein, partial [Pseudomonadota bacterium]